MALRNTDYAEELVTAGSEGGRIERILIKESGEEEVRFSWWKDGRFMPRALDVTEAELLPLIEEAVSKGVFTENFLSNLEGILQRRKNATFRFEVTELRAMKVGNRIIIEPIEARGRVPWEVLDALVDRQFMAEGREQPPLPEDRTIFER